MVLQLCGLCAAGLTNYAILYLNPTHRLHTPTHLPQTRFMFAAKDLPYMFAAVGMNRPIMVRCPRRLVGVATSRECTTGITGCDMWPRAGRAARGRRRRKLPSRSSFDGLHRAGTSA